MKKKIDIGARIVLGLILLAFGLNKFLQFMPMPEMPEAAGMAAGLIVFVLNVYLLFAYLERYKPILRPAK